MLFFHFFSLHKYPKEFLILEKERQIKLLYLKHLALCYVLKPGGVKPCVLSFDKTAQVLLDEVQFQGGIQKFIPDKKQKAKCFIYCLNFR